MGSPHSSHLADGRAGNRRARGRLQVAARRLDEIPLCHFRRNIDVRLGPMAAYWAMILNCASAAHTRGVKSDITAQTLLWKQAKNFAHSYMAAQIPEKGARVNCLTPEGVHKARVDRRCRAESLGGRL